MKQFLALLVFVLILPGCSSENSGIKNAINLRQQLLKSNGCTFHAAIVADYGEEVYEFQLDCQENEKGEFLFRVIAPDTISGISGVISEKGGNLKFDDKALFFEMLADDQITPISGPWLLLRTLKSGYITGAGKVEGGWQVQIDDSYEEDALQLNIVLNKDSLPKFGEILWKGRRVLSITVDNFTIL